MHAIILIVC